MSATTELLERGWQTHETGSGYAWTKTWRLRWRWRLLHHGQDATYSVRGMAAFDAMALELAMQRQRNWR